MHLREYLLDNGITASDFARQAGVTRQTIRAVCIGERNISLSLAMKIDELTKGEVTPHDIYYGATATHFKFTRKPKTEIEVN